MLKKTALRLALCLVALISPWAALAQSIFNCSTFNGGSSGACSVAPYYDNTNGFATTQQIWIRSTCQSSASPSCLSGTAANFVPTAATHNGYGMAYSVGKVNVQAFTETFTFVPNGWNFALVMQDDNTHSGFEGAAFSSGASCEAGFYQDDGVDPTPNNLFALDFDSSGYIGGSFSYSTVQIYQQHQSPCQPNDGGTHWYSTTKTSTSPVPLTSPASTQYSTTGDTYSATVTYDGSTLTLAMYDMTASGSCPGASCFTNTWSNVSIPSVVGASTAWLGFTSAVGSGSPQEPSQYPLLVKTWSYTVNTPTANPSTTAWNTGSTYNTGTVSAASPVYSVAPGTYSGTQSVSITSSTGSANICYVVSSTTPTLYPQVDNNGGCAAGTAYTGPVSIPSTSTLYAMAGTPWGTGPPSTLVAGTYTISPSNQVNGTMAGGMMSFVSEDRTK
jgi:hypothetical protein